MEFKRWVLRFLVFGEVIICIVLGYRLFLNIQLRKNVLGAQYVTRINKNSVITPPDKYLKSYYELKPNTTETEQPDWLPHSITYSYNAEGIRDEINYPIPKPPDTYRVLTMGDSFTFGAYVPLADTYSKKLASLLNNSSCSSQMKFEVINLGVPGYDIQYAVEHFRIHGVKYDPDLVLWLVNEHNVLQLRDLLTPLSEKIEKETSESAKLNYQKTYGYYFANDIAQREIEQHLTDSYIFAVQRQAMNRLSEMYSGPLIITTFSRDRPDVEDVLKGFAIKRRNTYFNDTLPQLDMNKGERFPDDHPSEVGHTIIAQEIFEYLQQSHIVSCLSL